MKSIWQKQMKIPLFDTIVSPSDPLCDGCGAVAVTERISRPHARSGPYDSAGTPPAERHRRIRAHAAAGREEWRQEEAGKRYGERRIRGGKRRGRARVGQEDVGSGRREKRLGRAGTESGAGGRDRGGATPPRRRNTSPPSGRRFRAAPSSSGVPCRGHGRQKSSRVAPTVSPAPPPA